jgi:acetoin utilization deacetylase AcuC-like enzyme
MHCPNFDTPSAEGSKGSWKAAIAGVGAAIQGVDRIMNGECVNVFCLTRPPGHHAGRELHPMKAVSNGFCLLNAVACAALYATAPVSEGGPGLRRVCVIDIDVHHGNGTQDILASTYDPRFLYVSVHAGGPDVNGVDAAEDEGLPSHHLGRTPKKGIFPGRCGDYSPHEGVLNIPLGPRVTSHALGTALVQKVSPAVEKFSPELIIVSAGFDAHKNDPLGLGALAAEDYATLTEVICKLAHKSCSGRVLSILEGGYGVPCCRPMEKLFDPEAAIKRAAGEESAKDGTSPPTNGGGGERDADTGQAKPDQTQKELEILQLGDHLPAYMKDDIPYPLRRKLDKCHAEGFMDCVRDHIRTLGKCNMRS